MNQASCDLESTQNSSEQESFYHFMLICQPIRVGFFFSCLFFLVYAPMPTLKLCSQIHFSENRLSLNFQDMIDKRTKK